MRCCFQFDAIVDLLLPSIQALSFDRIEKVRKVEIYNYCFVRFVFYVIFSFLNKNVCILQLFYKSVAEWISHGLQNSDSSSLKKRIPQLLPLLLLGIFDVSGEIGVETFLMVEDVGILYERSLVPSPSKEVTLFLFLINVFLLLIYCNDWRGYTKILEFNLLLHVSVIASEHCRSANIHKILESAKRRLIHPVDVVFNLYIHPRNFLFLKWIFIPKF